MPQVTPEDVKNQLDSINNEVKKAISATNEEVKKHGKIGADNAQKLDTLTNKIEEVTAQVLELEQQGTSQNDVENAVKSVGAQFTDSDAYKGFSAGNSTKASFEVENNIVVGSDVTVAPDRRSGVISGIAMPLRVLDVIPQGTTNSNAVEYVRELAYTNAAAETAEGDTAYPESAITFELVSAPVRNIGHFIYLSKQMVEDNSIITSYIDGRLRYGVELRKDTQTLVGNGTGQNLSGLFKTGNYTALAGATSGDDQYKNIRRAIAQVEANGYMVDAVFLNPADCANIDLIKATGGEYISTNPRMQNTKTVWGKPVVETSAMTSGKFLVSALAMSAQFTNRRGIIVEMSDSHDDNFTKDMVTLKATARAAMEIYRPASSVGGDLVTA
ncbi:phage major capsid protein [Neptunicella sp.]|uniref:phage major capsid protein n=1 Tax=Neptunicella sp. TaxID=2125986 RepID=UPI003F68E664